MPEKEGGAAVTDPTARCRGRLWPQAHSSGRRRDKQERGGRAQEDPWGPKTSPGLSIWAPKAQDRKGLGLGPNRGRQGQP